MLADANIITSYKGRAVDISRPVRVYRNLHRGGYSIKQGRQVVAHAERLCLKDVRFIVSERGRQRVLRDGHKCVHAYAEGIICSSGMGVTAESTRLPVKVVYNPWIMDSFQTEGFAPPMKVVSAMFATFNSKGVFAAYTEGTKL